jgi:hypothetical protein
MYMQAWHSLSSLHLYHFIIVEGCHIPQQIIPACYNGGEQQEIQRNGRFSS